MRRAILPITLTAAGLGAFGLLMWSIFAGQRDDVAIARDFLTFLAEGDHVAAAKLVTPELGAELRARPLTQVFGEIEDWTALRFPSRSSDMSNGRRMTEITGTGETISGCESRLSLRLIDGLVDMVNVTPLCPAAGRLL